MNKKLLFLALTTIFTTNITQCAQNNSTDNTFDKYKELNPLIGAEWSEKDKKWYNTSGMAKSAWITTPMATSSSNQDPYAEINNQELDAMRSERQNQRKEDAKQRDRERGQQKNYAMNSQPNMMSQESRDLKIQRLQQQIAELESLNDDK